jgi:glyoxylase-like metal-dependent hydrolase (beta-lactamase superfamily II)
MSYPVHEAVTAVLSHGDEIYITRRQPHLLAFPGFWAFPGGKVDKTDSVETYKEPLLATHPPQLMRALLRELAEETGLDLAAEIGSGNVRGFACLGETTTPAFAPLRFRTWFFRIDFRQRPAIALDPGEAAEGEWAPASLWRERFARGRLLVVPPTRAVIERLAAVPDADTVPLLTVDFDLERQVPMVEPIGGLTIMLVRSNTVPPADRTNAFLIGDPGTRRVLVDPSPADRAELQRLSAILDDFRPDEIFLTHHHPDHREYADELARLYQIPIGMSADTHQRIARKTAGRFFENIETKIYKEGDRLAEWQGEAVNLFAVPGHDEGQLAVMPQSRAWCIVSDLIQGVGTVVIGGPESSMRKYFGSLQRVIDLDPGVVIPSHGQALGTTYRIKETLKHRVLREQQVKSLHDGGRSVDAMIPEIYQGLDPRLLPLARMNIESHLVKLREDGLINN